MSVPLDDIRTTPLRASGAPAANSPPQSSSSKMPPTPIEPFLLIESPAGGTLLPRRLGQYEVEEVLGQGGFGVVVRAFDPTLQRPVAIKALLPHGAVAGPRAGFLHEARAAAKVRHENVVQIYSVHESPIPHLVMEFVEGETLQARLNRAGAMDWRVAARIGLEIAHGLAAAHAQGLVHRDIKPANILLQKPAKPSPKRIAKSKSAVAPKVKIADFGVARVIDDAAASQSGVVIGTPVYMAPEQANGKAVDHRSDLFSLGSVLYAMVVGQPPFLAPTSTATLKRVAEDRPRPIRQLRSGVDPRLCALIDRLLAKSPQNRFQNATAVALALEECLKSPRKPGMLRRAALWVTAASLATFAAYLGYVSGRSTGLTDANPNANPAPAVIPSVTPAVSIIPPVNPPGTPAERPVSPMATTPTVIVRSPEEMSDGEWEAWVGRQLVEKQVAAMEARLYSLNPGLQIRDNSFTSRDGAVETYEASFHRLKDIRPFRALKQVRTLKILSFTPSGPFVNSKLSDLEPLRGMQIEALCVYNTEVVDLSPLAGMPLRHLGMWSFAGHDLSPLRGMQLDDINCGESKVTDLSPLAGMPLRNVCINGTEIEDVTPLRDAPLEMVIMERTKVRDFRPVLRPKLKVFRVEGSPIADLDLIRPLTNLEELSLTYDPNVHYRLVKSYPGLRLMNQRPVDEFFRDANNTPRTPPKK